jgi:hypothetical protein
MEDCSLCGKGVPLTPPPLYVFVSILQAGKSSARAFSTAIDSECVGGRGMRVGDCGGLGLAVSRACARTTELAAFYQFPPLTLWVSQASTTSSLLEVVLEATLLPSKRRS